MKKILTLLILFSAFSFAQPCFLNKPSFTGADNYYSGLASNGVTDIVFQGDSLIWFGTGGGLSMTPDFGANLYGLYQDEDGLPRGGISAVAVQDSLIWVAAIFDSTTSEGSMQTGGGLAYSKDCGITWTFIAQPIDDASDTVDIWAGENVYFLPVVTPVSNTTWDVAIGDHYIYIVSWAGGLRRTSDFGRTWQRVPLPSDDDNFLTGAPDYQINPRDPAAGGNHNHKGFSVLCSGDTVWVGTANGINRGIEQWDGSINWIKYNFENAGISGDFVVALDRQYYKGVETIWAVTLPAVNSGESRAVSYSSDGGASWKVTLEGERAYSFAFDDSVVYVATENGLFKSLDGENWSKYQNIEDFNSETKIYSEYVYCAAIDKREGEKYLWLGTGDGIAKTSDDGLNWEVYRYALSTTVEGQPDIYAYPNPFSPTHQNILNDDGHVRIHYYLDAAADIQLEVFDFAMNRVYRSEKISVATPGDHDLVWNGKTNGGRLTANGTYFCKLTRKMNGKEEFFWTKLIVLN